MVIMQIIEEVSARLGLVALLQEKPFHDNNRSEKHNNWSIATDDGVVLLHPTKLNEATTHPYALVVVMAAVCLAVDEHGNLVRMAIATPGNDFRLGACEAPPAIVSTYLGDDMTAYLEAFKDGKSGQYPAHQDDRSRPVGGRAIPGPSQGSKSNLPLPLCFV